MGYVGCLGWTVIRVFWGLLYYGRYNLSSKWTWPLALLWLAGWGLGWLIPGVFAFFLPFVALLDIVLVLVVCQGICS